jgi:hypothetical protein
MNLRVVGFFLVFGVATFSWLMTYGAWQYQKVAAGVVPIETRSYPRLTLVAVGTGGAYENPDRRGPSTAVAAGPRILLVDAGRSVAEGLRNATISVAQPDTVLLTPRTPRAWTTCCSPAGSWGGPRRCASWAHREPGP